MSDEMFYEKNNEIHHYLVFGLHVSPLILHIEIHFLENVKN